MAAQNAGADDGTAHALCTLQQRLAGAAGGPLRAARLAMVDATVLVSGLTDSEHPCVWLHLMPQMQPHDWIRRACEMSAETVHEWRTVDALR